MNSNPDELREVRAAAEDVKRHAGLYDVANIIAREHAALKLANHILAEHPADDSLPVDEEWLRSVGFYRPMQPAASNWFSSQEAADNADGTKTPVISIAFPTRNSRTVPAWTVFACDYPRHYNACPTRGDVRRLCRALGVPLAAPGERPTACKRCGGTRQLYTYDPASDTERYQRACPDCKAPGEGTRDE